MTARPYVTATLDGQPRQVVSWSASRGISGSGMPGQVRVTSGEGAGSGSLDIFDPLLPTPWGDAGAAQPGASCTLDVSLDGGLTTSPVLRGAIRQVDVPGLLTPVRSLSIEDDRSRLQRPLWVDATFPIGAAGSVIDAAALVELAARAGGYRATPAPYASLLSVPLCGSLAVEAGDMTVTSTGVVSWQTIGGRIAPNPLTAATYTLGSYPTPAAGPLYVAATAHPGTTATLEMRAYAADGTTYQRVLLRYGTISGSNALWEASRDGGTTWSTLRIFDKTLANRFEASITWTSSTQVLVRSRIEAIGHSAPVWDAGVTLTGTAITATTWRRAVLTGVLTALQVTSAASDAYWRPETARIAASGSPLTSILLPKTIKSIDAIQEITSATDAAWWIDESGVLTYMPRTTLLAKTKVEDIVSLTDLRDVSASTSTDDLVDRVEATFSPPVVSTVTDYSLGIFEATDKIEVAAGATVTAEYDLETSVADLATWAQATTGAEPTLSRWDASVTATGGTKVPTSGVTISSVLLSPRRVRITIKNNTAGRIWMVDGRGDPYLIVRANKRVDAGEQQTVSAGATADAALHPATLDLGAYVQTATRAQAIADSLMTALATPMPVLTSLQVYPSPSRHLGDVVTLSDPITGLSCRGVICKIDNSGAAGSWQQTIDLAVLAYL